MESSRLKRIASKLKKNPRRINKEMAWKIYEQTCVTVAIGSGNNKSTHSLQSSYLLESIKKRNWRKGFSQGFSSRQKGVMLSHNISGGHFALFEV